MNIINKLREDQEKHYVT